MVVRDDLEMMPVEVIAEFLHSLHDGKTFFVIDGMVSFRFC